jgi:two-component system sensor histidine kinase BaeS
MRTLSVIRQYVRSGLRLKLFVVLLIPVILAVVATSTAARIAFLRGFLGYLNEQEVTQVRAMVPAIARAYRSNEGWEFLSEDPHAWFEILMQIDRGAEGPAAPGPGELWEVGAFPAPPAPHDLTGLATRLALLDAGRQFVAGNPALGAKARREPIVLDGRVIGWLAVLPFDQLTAGAAGAFQSQQLVSTWVIAGVAVGLAAAVALLFSYRLLVPLRRIGAATHRLAAGDYATRLEVLQADEIGRLAADFNRMAVTLEKNETLRRGFMADLSHELRTPLAILRAELEAIEDRVRELTPEALRSLQAEVVLLGKLINDLYDLSLAEVGALTYRVAPIDVGGLLRQRLTAFQERYAQRRISMQVSIPPEVIWIDADAMRIQQLINNLLENSLRHTHSGGQFRVSCRIERPLVALDLQDSAPGVSEEVLPRLFERFYRGDPSRSRATGGAGLGLAIAKSIVEAHGGSIEACGSPLGGLRIRVALPLR